MLGGVEGSRYPVQVRQEGGCTSSQDGVELGEEYFSKSEVTQSVDDLNLHHNGSKPLQIPCIPHTTNIKYFITMQIMV